MTFYTGPEWFCDSKKARGLVRTISRAPCKYCLHRDRSAPDGFETCQLFGRAFPICNTDGRAFQFELDPTTIEVTYP